MRLATNAEIAGWDQLVAGNPDGGDILQTRAWGEVKSRWGWEPLHLVGQVGGATVALLALRRSIPGFGPLWYCPKGPGVTSVEALIELLGERASAFPDGFLAKVEPSVLRADRDLTTLAPFAITKPAQDVQIHSATIVIDLAREDDALLASFKSKTRYNIRLAQRKGVAVKAVPVSGESVRAMYRLMASTARRAGFPLRPRGYFEDYWTTQSAAGQGSLYFAHLDGEVLAGAFVTNLGAKAWYKDGGSTTRRRELMAPHLLQWEIMRDLRGRGITSYDLVAVPRPDERSDSHPLAGLWRFKSGFSDAVTEYVGTLDVTLAAKRARVWGTIGERVAVRYLSRVRDDLLY